MCGIWYVNDFCAFGRDRWQTHRLFADRIISFLSKAFIILFRSVDVYLVAVGEAVVNY